MGCVIPLVCFMMRYSHCGLNNSVNVFYDEIFPLWVVYDSIYVFYNKTFPLRVI